MTVLLIVSGEVRWICSISFHGDQPELLAGRIIDEAGIRATVFPLRLIAPADPDRAGKGAIRQPDGRKDVDRGGRLFGADQLILGGGGHRCAGEEEEPKQASGGGGEARRPAQDNATG